MRTRCPVCSTIFRVTSEQLRLKAGKVRCGQCQAVFNAFDQFLTDTVVAGETPVQAPVAVPADAPVKALVEAMPPPVRPQEPDPGTVSAVPSPRVVTPVILPATPEIAPESAPAPFVPPTTPTAEAVVVKLSETPEESAMAAREAGLMAARELTDTPAYNRWAASPLAGSGLSGFEPEAKQYALWPFVVFSGGLLIALLGQSLFHFRTELAQRFPVLVGVYQFAAVDIPLPRQAEWVSIESSDLQSDNARGLFVLQATLHNRANYAQDWPALELTFTDTGDKVVSRRVLRAVEYLPPATESASFPANGEIAIKLWIEAKDIGAAGYRLYLFYP